MDKEVSELTDLLIEAANDPDTDWQQVAQEIHDSYKETPDNVHPSYHHDLTKLKDIHGKGG